MLDLLLQVLLESQERPDRIDLALVRVRYSVHAAPTVPQLDLVASTCGEVHVQIALERQRFYAVDLAVVRRHDAHFDVFVA